jgi:hypothetical protein
VLRGLSSVYLVPLGLKISPQGNQMGTSLDMDGAPSRVAHPSPEKFRAQWIAAWIMRSLHGSGPGGVLVKRDERRSAQNNLEVSRAESAGVAVVLEPSTIVR